MNDEGPRQARARAKAQAAERTGQQLTLPGIDDDLILHQHLAKVSTVVTDEATGRALRVAGRERNVITITPDSDYV